MSWISTQAVGTIPFDCNSICNFRKFKNHWIENISFFNQHDIMNASFDLHDWIVMQHKSTFNYRSECHKDISIVSCKWYMQFAICRLKNFGDLKEVSPQIACENLWIISFKSLNFFMQNYRGKSHCIFINFPMIFRWFSDTFIKLNAKRRPVISLINDKQF